MRAMKVVAMVFGGCAIGSLILMSPVLSSEDRPSSIFVAVRQSVEGLTLVQVLLIAIAGVIWGVTVERFYAFYAAGSQPLILPLIAVIEIIKDPARTICGRSNFSFTEFLPGFQLVVRSVDNYSGDV